MTAVSFVNVLRLLIIRVPRVPGTNINEVPNSEEFSHSAGGPQLELRWGPGRAKRARARPSFDRVSAKTPETYIMPCSKPVKRQKKNFFFRSEKGNFFFFFNN